MTNSKEPIFIVGTYLIKQDKDWKMYAKQVLDEEVWEELLYWRTEVKGPNNEPVTSVEEVEKLLIYK